MFAPVSFSVRVLVVVFTGLLVGCEFEPVQEARVVHQTENSNACELLQSPDVIAEMQSTTYDDLATHFVDHPLADAYIERAGWMFVEQARKAYDDGFYLLALAAADCLDQRKSSTPEALLLRAYSLHQLHRFDDAEHVAKQLVALRGEWFDRAVLGDVLLDKGDMEAAGKLYQTVLSERPGPQAYARAAQWRYLQGDLAGSIDMLKQAVSSSSHRTPVDMAWLLTRLAERAWIIDGDEIASRLVARALQAQPDFPAALALEARVLEHQQQPDLALDRFRAAYQSRPGLETGWPYLEALRRSGDLKAAAIVEAELRRDGASEDPTGFALYLAESQTNSREAIALAQSAFDKTGNAYARDALAWALYTNGQTDAAWEVIEPLSEVAPAHPRFHLHVGLIALSKSKLEIADKLLRRANQARFLLMQSEKDRLVAAGSVLPGSEQSSTL